MTSEVISRVFEYATTYDKILAIVGSFLILFGIIGEVDGKIKMNLSLIRQFIMVFVGLIIVLIPIFPLIFRDITLQELKAVKANIDQSKVELGRLNDPNGGDHGHYLDNDLIEAQKLINNLIAKKEGN